MLEKNLKGSHPHSGEYVTQSYPISYWFQIIAALRGMASLPSVIEPTEAMLQAALDADIGTLDTPLRELYRLIYTAMRSAEGKDHGR